MRKNGTRKTIGVLSQVFKYSTRPSYSPVLKKILDSILDPKYSILELVQKSLFFAQISRKNGYNKFRFQLLTLSFQENSQIIQLQPQIVFLMNFLYRLWQKNVKKNFCHLIKLLKLLDYSTKYSTRPKKLLEYSK